MGRAFERNGKWYGESSMSGRPGGPVGPGVAYFSQVGSGRNLSDSRKRINKEKWQLEDRGRIVPQQSAVHGRFGVNGAGEAQKQVFFPCWFTEVPSFQASFEVQDPSQIQSGKSPEISAYIVDWLTESRGVLAQTYYAATIRVVSSGPITIKFIVHWTMTGMATEGTLISLEGSHQKLSSIPYI